jgi:indolepyruvate ferredoxin oxidoreductase
VQAVQFARLPEHIRGFGHVKEKHVAKVKAQWAELMAKFA